VVNPQENPLLIVIVGATGSGKTALSLVLAEKFSGEIISCDSVAVYREFEIGTAKPSLQERQRFPHHLIDVADPAQANFTAGQYSRLGRVALHEIKERENTPIVVGGTGLYLRALLQGLFAGPRRSEELRERLRGRVEKRGTSYLHRVLQRMDPAAATNIHANDVPKIIRAIEICFATQEKMSELWKRGRDPLEGFRVVRIGLNPERQLLYDRINARSRRMFEDGLVDETRALASKYPQTLDIPNSPLNSLGYRQALEHIRGKCSLDEAVAATQQAHRNYAKRQMTWFRREPEIRWLQGFGDEPTVQSKAIEILNERV
jgi:tRNA dimethylallyltransferase